VKKLSITLSDAAIADILDQSDWYEAQADRSLAQRWEQAVTTTLLRITRRADAGSLCMFSGEELRGTRRMPVAGFARHLVFYQSRKAEIFVLRVLHGARDLEGLFPE
jgi:toxin ParE1/3/4